MSPAWLRRHRALSRGLLGLVATGLLLLSSAPVALAAPPTNDDRSGATPITLTAGASIDLTDATTALDDPGPCMSGDTEYKSVWFSYTATEAGTTLIGAITNEENALHVLAPDGTTELGCVVGSPALVAPHVDIDAVVGETYLIEVAATADLATLGGIGIERPLVFSAEPLPAGHVTTAGDVRFDWTVACSVAGYLEIGIDLDQGSGPNRAIGSELQTVDCFPPQVVVPMTVTHGLGANPDARFHAGDADARFRVTMFTFAQTQSLDTSVVIRLTGGPSPTSPTVAPPATDTATASGPAAPPERPSFVALIAGIGLVAAGAYRLRRPRFPRA